MSRLKTHVHILFSYYTVNTASRCESLGSPNRIHISDQTAKLIMDAGYGSWLTKRKDIIEAKGKGLMQTYWVEPRVGTNSCMSTTSRLSSDGHEYDYEDIDDPARAVVVPLAVMLTTIMLSAISS